MVMIIIRAYNAENTQVKLYNMYLENLNALKRYQAKYWYVNARGGFLRESFYQVSAQ